MKGYDTPIGTFKIGRKEKRSWSVPYKVWLPYASYFTSDGVAFHARHHRASRTPATAACACPRAFAREIYDLLTPGTTVIVTPSVDSDPERSSAG